MPIVNPPSNKRRQFIPCMSLVMVTTVMTGISACSSTDDKYVVEEIETDLDAHQAYGHDGKIGLDDEGKAIVQRENTAAVELAMQRRINGMLKESLIRENAELTSCRTDMADPRLGGTGELVEIDELTELQSIVTVDETLGIDEEGDLKIVKKSYYVDELKSQRQYETSLRKMQKLVKKHHQSCQRQLRIARVNAGLPASRIAAKGYFSPQGRWIETRRGERTLDDAFELTSRGTPPETKQ